MVTIPSSMPASTPRPSPPGKSSTIQQKSPPPEWRGASVSSLHHQTLSHVQIPYLLGVRLDEAFPGWHGVAHQHVERPVRGRGVLHCHLQQDTVPVSYTHLR